MANRDGMRISGGRSQSTTPKGPFKSTLNSKRSGVFEIRPRSKDAHVKINPPIEEPSVSNADLSNLQNKIDELTKEVKFNLANLTHPEATEPTTKKAFKKSRKKLVGKSPEDAASASESTPLPPFSGGPQEYAHL